MYRIRKLFKFEMAHLLSSSYSEECQAIHGHSYQMEVIIETTQLNKDGMVIDFKSLKEIVNDLVISVFDHSLVFENISSDSKSYIEFKHLMSNLIVHRNMVVVEYNPTAENMAKDIHNRIHTVLRHHIEFIRNLKIRLHETDTGYAEYSGGL